ncbi:LPXTG cell wall anchor domain-containing protein [Alphaproteobacteria bacterium]|jgi:LPXTG-motif cell wall-anchored protein|nr:LPXTG cell wall anchor domain-containing protein [Alphaproteobacteria bacterium]|tara:strand:- start:436 stop:537 length:102 start_codon:yes stop_codon:yes gene_type:complete
MEFLIWFWNAGELLMFLGISIIVIGLIFYKKKK